MSFPLRPGTNDDVIYNSVVVRNEYRLPDRFDKKSIVVDIGAHVGMFSYAALTRGAGVVHGFEPDPENFRCARENLSTFGDRVRLTNCAVWRSDVPVPALHLWPSGDATNTGGGTVIWQTDGPIVEAVPFDEVIRSICQSGRRRINLLKIDCEGAEFPILLTSNELDNIDAIAGEYHELRTEPPAHARVPGCAEFSLSVLVSTLERAGFRVDTERQATCAYGDLGLFFATRG